MLSGTLTNTHITAWTGASEASGILQQGLDEVFGAIQVNEASNHLQMDGCGRPHKSHVGGSVRSQRQRQLHSVALLHFSILFSILFSAVSHFACSSQPVGTSKGFTFTT